MFMTHAMPTVGRAGAARREAKGTTRGAGTDGPADSRHWERSSGLCDELRASEPPRAGAGGKHGQG